MKRYNLIDRGACIVIRFTTKPNKAMQGELQQAGYTPYGSAKTWFGKGHKEHLEKVLEAWNRHIEGKHYASKRTQTLCVECAKSGFGDCSECSWERSFIPVQGWTAERHEHVHYKTEIGRAVVTESYFVQECPEFERMKRRCQRTGSQICSPSASVQKNR